MCTKCHRTCVRVTAVPVQMSMISMLIWSFAFALLTRFQQNPCLRLVWKQLELVLDDRAAYKRRQAADITYANICSLGINPQLVRITTASLARVRDVSLCPADDPASWL